MNKAPVTSVPLAGEMHELRRKPSRHRDIQRKAISSRRSLIFLAAFANPFCRTGHIPTIGTHGHGWSWKNSFDYVRWRTYGSATR